MTMVKRRRRQGVASSAGLSFARHVLATFRIRHEVIAVRGKSSIRRSDKGLTVDVNPAAAHARAALGVIMEVRAIGGTALCIVMLM